MEACKHCGKSFKNVEEHISKIHYVSEIYISEKCGIYCDSFMDGRFLNYRETRENVDGYTHYIFNDPNYNLKNDRTCYIILITNNNLDVIRAVEKKLKRKCIKKGRIDYEKKLEWDYKDIYSKNIKFIKKE